MSFRKFICGVFSRSYRESTSVADPTDFYVPADALRFNRLVMQTSWEEAQAAQSRWEALVAKKNDVREQRRPSTPMPPSPAGPSAS